MKRYYLLILAIVLPLLAACGCDRDGDAPAPPAIERITAEADVYSATVSFHVSGGLEGVRESGIRFGLDELDADDNPRSETRVQGGEDPSRHDYIIIKLENLQASTRYYYQVFIGNGRSQVRSDILTFTTRAASSTPPPGPNPDWLEVPDPQFLAVLVSRFDRDADGGLDPQEAALVTEMDVSGLGLTDLRGIELFPNLASLNCQDNLLPELDISACPVLSDLDCNPMQDAAHQTVLKTLWIRRNQPIESIDKPEKTVIRIKE